MSETILNYLLNCFLLIIPILVWNIIFAPKLKQEGFKNNANVSALILYAEHALRFFVFLFPVFIPLSFENKGFTIYLIGTIIYFLSWLPLIYFQEKKWTTNVFVVLAPFFTPLIWLVGIGIIGNSIGFIVVSILFILVHILHGLKSFGFYRNK